MQPRQAPVLVYGVLLITAGFGLYIFGTVLSVPRYLVGNPAWLLRANEWIVWYSGMPVMAGLALSLLDLFVLLRRKRSALPGIRNQPLESGGLTVALTAYDDEESIADAVMDFRAHPLVGRVIVVSNNSRDRTLQRARAAGAVAVNEPRQGYGHCVYRCFQEALAGEGGPVILCEGDRTFRAADIDKLLAYAPHADVVNGTRTVERLRAPRTQLSTFMYYGNLFVGKLLEAKHLGQTTITDVGTTYKLVRRNALRALLPNLDPEVNLEFNAHFLDRALVQGLDVVECPITFHPRVGLSKGGNVNNLRALKVGLRMIRGILFGWGPAPQPAPRRSLVPIRP